LLVLNAMFTRPTLVAIVLRFTVITFLFVALVVTGSGAGVLCKGSSCEVRRYPDINIVHWWRYGGEMVAQYIAFVLMFLLLLVMIGLLIYRIKTREERYWFAEFVTLIIVAIFVTFLAILEAWLSSSSYDSTKRDFTIVAWAVASAVLFITVIVLVVDMFLTRKQDFGTESEKIPYRDTDHVITY